LTQRDWQGAVADFTRGGEPPATNEFAYEYAAALLLAGRRSEYHRFMNQMAERYSSSGNAFTLYVLARMAALSERPVVPAKRMVEWAKRAVEQGPTGWYYHALGLATFRAGDPEAAIRAIDDSRRTTWRYGDALNDCAMGLAHLRRGRRAEARYLVERARNAMERMAMQVRNDQLAGPGIPVSDWLELQLLLPQLEGPLYDAGFPTEAFAR
jgi:hypothetical protein